jgi:hypothetical protein
LVLSLIAWLIVSRYTDIKLPHAIYFTWAQHRHEACFPYLCVAA